MNDLNDIENVKYEWKKARTSKQGEIWQGRFASDLSKTEMISPARYATFGDQAFEKRIKRTMSRFFRA